MSNSLDPDQARRFTGPDLGPNCLHRLISAKVDTSGERDNYAQTKKSLNRQHRQADYSSHLLSAAALKSSYMVQLILVENIVI